MIRHRVVGDGDGETVKLRLSSLTVDRLKFICEILGEGPEEAIARAIAALDRVVTARIEKSQVVVKGRDGSVEAIDL